MSATAPFLLGVALSAHQTEGEEVASDWWEAARAGKVPDPGEALAFLRRYPEDMATIARLGLNAVRLSVEWARLEPEPGRFDAAAFARYADVVATARRQGLAVVVTLHHFTLPSWLAAAGGVLAPSSAAAFGRFAAAAAERLPPPDVYLTVNEPLVLSAMGYLLGRWPPFSRRVDLAVRAALALAAWHREGYRQLKARRPDVPVGLAHHFLAFRADSPLARPWVRLADGLFHVGYLRWAAPLDVLGVNYYTTAHLGAWPRLRAPTRPVTEMGWEVAPEGLRAALATAARVAPRVFVSENGVATEDEALREDFLRRHLVVVAEARRSGLPVFGYFYWTLYDNYEWAEGYRAHFGLGDRGRHLRPAAWRLAPLWEELARGGPAP